MGLRGTLSSLFRSSEVLNLPVCWLLLHVLFICNENFKLLLTVTPRSTVLETDWMACAPMTNDCCCKERLARPTVSTRHFEYEMLVNIIEEIRQRLVELYHTHYLIAYCLSNFFAKKLSNSVEI